MSKTVCIISASPRTNSNSERLAEAFAQGAREAGHLVQEIRLREHTYGFCQGCLACIRTGTCVLKDDAVQIAQTMHDADVLVFATPIYYYEMSGQLKTMLDRANPLYGSDYKFQDVYMLTAAAENEAGTDFRAVQGLEGWIACFERARLAGTVFAGGVNEPGQIEGHPAIEQALAMGRNV